MTQCRLKHKHPRIHSFLVVALVNVTLASAQDLTDDWWATTLSDLSTQHGVEATTNSCARLGERLDRLAAVIGENLAESAREVSTSDVASLALLLATRPLCGEQKPPGEATTDQSPPLSVTSAPTGSQLPSAVADIGKGEEGLIQGIERLGSAPLSERLVITGDIVSGVQMATVPKAPTLSSVVGRTRLNFVVRAVPETPTGQMNAGYFFLQLRAAGGPFDSSPVGGPSSFSAFNDVATDRSRFNEGTSRGNVYLSKAFFQQQLSLGQGSVTGRIGIVNQSDFFDTNQLANNENRQFINSAFVNSAGYKTGISAPGFTVEYRRPWDWKIVDAITYRVGYSLSRTDRAFSSPLWNGEVAFGTTLNGLLGNWRFGGSVGNVADTGGVRGFHFSGNQALSSEYGLFLRYAVNNSGPGSEVFGPVKQSYSLGLQRRFMGGNSPSTWGIGFSQAFPIHAAERTASERVMETYYRWQLLENFSIAPDFQLVFGSGGRERDGTQAVFGFNVVLGLEGGM